MDKVQDPLKAEVMALSRTVKRGPQSKYSEDQQLLILKAYLTNQFSSKELMQKFGVHRTQLKRWKAKFAAETPPEPATHSDATHSDATAAGLPSQNPTFKDSPQETPPMAKQTKPVADTPDQDELTRLQTENQRLQEQLKMAEWMVHARDVMIEEAEKTFNIAIRKKSGAKQ